MHTILLYLVRHLCCSKSGHIVGATEIHKEVPTTSSANTTAVEVVSSKWLLVPIQLVTRQENTRLRLPLASLLELLNDRAARVRDKTKTHTSRARARDLAGG